MIFLLVPLPIVLTYLMVFHFTEWKLKTITINLQWLFHSYSNKVRLLLLNNYHLLSIVRGRVTYEVYIEE